MLRRHMIKVRFVFYLLFGSLAFFTLLTPHIIHGHSFISENYAQSLVLLLDFLTAYALYVIYKRKMQSLVRENYTMEERLSSSYIYIGKMNNVVALFKKFSSLISVKNQDTIKKNSVFDSMLASMLVSVAKTDRGFVRFIDAESGNTIREFLFSKNSNEFYPKLSNVAILEGKIDDMDKKDIIVVESDYRNLELRCVLCFPNDDQIVDFEILRALLNQMHLLFIAVNEK